MTQDTLNNLYFEWMFSLVCNSDKRLSYRKLLYFLHSTNFDYTIPMDGNRAEDGINLRYRFGSEEGYEDAMIASYLDNRPCSVFEMMVALCIRCEEKIMCDPDIGDRTGQWFWNMINNLGLSIMTDARYDRNYVANRVNRFLNREYERNGKGGLFTIHNCREDMRQIEIWYQMCWYLDDIL